MHCCACSSKRVLLLTKPSLPFWLHAPACLSAALKWGPCGDRPGAPAHKHNHSGGPRSGRACHVHHGHRMLRIARWGGGGGAFRRTPPCRGEGAWWPPRCCTRWWRRPRYSHGIPAISIIAKSTPHPHTTASQYCCYRYSRGTVDSTMESPA